MDNNSMKNKIYGRIKMSDKAADIIVAAVALILLTFIAAAILISI